MSRDHSPDTVPSHSISFDAARRVLDAAVHAAQDLGRQMCVVIADQSGLPILTARMDGAPRLSLKIAEDKAYSVASFGGAPTDGWWDMIKDQPALVHGITHTPRLVIFGGGLPLLVRGEVVGAIGVSGGTADEDREIAQAGSDSLD
jgi:glc operon protein GlcG